MSVVVVMVGFLFAMAGIAVYAAFHARRLRSITSDLPVSALGGIAAGYRLSRGRAAPSDGGPLESPLTGTACVWYSIKVERYEPADDDGVSSWSTVKKDESDAPFLIEDSSGKALLLPTGAEVIPADTAVWYGPAAIPEDRTPARRPFGHSDVVVVELANMTDRRFRYTETCIYVGDPLVVHGSVTSTRGLKLAKKGSPHQELPRFARDRADRRPFLIVASALDTHRQLLDHGVMGALFVAAFPLAIAAWLLYVRFG